MIAFIDDHRGAHGVEPICKVLPIAPSTYHDHMAKRADPGRLSDRARRDAELRSEIKRVHAENFGVCGVRKVWHQLRREGFDVARCTVARLMKDMAMEAVVRGQKIRTMIPDTAAPCPLDRVNRQVRVPALDMLWGCPLWRHRFKPDGRRPHLGRGMAGRPAWQGVRHGPRTVVVVSRTDGATMTTGLMPNPTSPSSSTPTPGGSSAGASAGPPMPASCSMPLSRRFSNAIRQTEQAWSAIRIADLKAVSTARRTGILLGVCQVRVQHFGRCSPPEGLAWPAVARGGDGIEHVWAMEGGIGAFGEVLAQQADWCSRWCRAAQGLWGSQKETGRPCSTRSSACRAISARSPSVSDPWRLDG